MYKRWIQFGSAVIAMVMIANLQYAWTMFVPPLRAAHKDWALHGVQLAFTLFIFFETWITPVEGWMIDKLGPRIFLTMGGLLCGLGWTGMGYAQTLMQLWIWYALAGVGAAFVYSGSIATALKWFPDMRGRASGFITAGFGAGSMLFIPLIADILKTSGYKQAFLYTGIGQGLVILVAAQVLQNPGPDFKVSAAAKKPVSPKLRRNTVQFTSAQMMMTPQFWLMYVAFVLTSVGGLMITAQAGPVAKGMALPAASIVLALSLSRGANGLGRVVWGWLSDYLGREMAMVIPFALQAACIVSVLTLGKISGGWFIATMFAVYFTWGSMFSLFPAIVGDYFGADHATSNYGFLYTAKGVASIGGGWIAAKLFERFGNWNADFYGTAALALVSSFMILALKAMPLPKRAEVESEMVLAKTGT